MKGKGLTLWIAGVGVTLTQIYLFLTSTWQKVVFFLTCFIFFYIFCKIPKEFHLLFWVIATLITTIFYYVLKPAQDSATLFIPS